MSDATPPSRTAAIVFSLIMPGVGHIHAGHVLRGVVVHTTYQVGVLSCLATLWNSSQLLFTGVATMVVLGRAFAIFDVLRLVRTSKVRGSWGLVFGLGALLYLLGSAGMRLVRDRVVDAAAMPSTAMAPTLKYGDRFFVDRTAPIETGDIVVYRDAETFVGRVIAKEGQRVALQKGRVLVDGAELPRCEIGLLELAPGRRRVFLERHGDRLHFVAEPVEGGIDVAEEEVPAGQIYLLGDHREGTEPVLVDVNGIVGPVSQVFWGAEGSTDADVSGRDGVAIPPVVETKREALDACRDELLAK